MRTHGMADSPEYKSWQSFKRRKQLAREWHRSFDTFFSVVGKRPEGMRLVRINKKKLLGPKNWMWSTRNRDLPESIKRKLLTGKDRQAVIVEARKAGATLQDIGDVLGFTKERVRQLESYGPKWKPRRNGKAGPRQKTLERDKRIAEYFKDGFVNKNNTNTHDPHPTVLYGYGAYGISRDPVFSHALISLLDRGVVFAVGHPRGGGENGRLWYEEGKYLKKPNTFTDFLACAESLIRDGVTVPDRLAIQGGSAGGLLVGAVLNLRPELFHAAIAQVPFVDVVNTMLDKELPLTMIEYDEWGNPEEKEFFDCMLSYAPYENVRAKPYPHLLATAGLTDPRVGFWEPAKWVAKLREFSTSDRMLLLKTRMGAGHGGASGRYDAIREVAFNYAFLLKAFSTR